MCPRIMIMIMIMIIGLSDYGEAGLDSWGCHCRLVQQRSKHCWTSRQRHPSASQPVPFLNCDFAAQDLFCFPKQDAKLGNRVLRIGWSREAMFLTDHEPMSGSGKRTIEA